MPQQQTVAGPVSFSGVGLHTGCQVIMTILPAPPDTGYVFRRTDLDNFPLEVSADHIANVSYATTIMKKGVVISTVEHVLSALYGLKVDNAFIDIDNIEVPIMDGSALPFCRGILEAGIEDQTEARRLLEVRKHVRHELGDKIIEAFPFPRLEVQYSIDFPHHLIGFQQCSFEITTEIYLNEIAPCRTFGFMREIQHLKENGLIKGGSLENAIVLDDEKVLNPEGLRFPDEFVRHKAMDFLGDISLIGGQIIGRFNAHKAGHGVHAALVRKILSDPANYRFISSESLPAALAV